MIELLIASIMTLMRNPFTPLIASAVISSILVLPFLLLELINRQEFRAREGFPFTLFAWLWLQPVAFGLILMPTVRYMRAGNKSRLYPIRLLLSAAVLILIAWLWVDLLLDQMPCFLGVPNCD